jgi:hypothetical protein
MGVFARFLRRSKGKEEASTAEAPAESLTAESATVAKEAKSAETEAAEAEATAAADAENTAESVEIPKQQSAEKAADNEAGESARN